MKIYKLILLLILANVCLSCDDYLEEPPSKTSSLIPETVAHLDALLNAPDFFGNEENNDIVYGTDDFALLTEITDGLPSLIGITAVQRATWDVDFSAANGRPSWAREWTKIFRANLVLQNLSSVSGDDQEKKELEAEAHFIRAYSYFQLANTYCLPFLDANKAELGLPIKTSTSFEQSLERVTLEETWEFIEADLMQALELTRELHVVNGYNRIWRASTVAVNGFAARYYLAKSDYANAQLYAQKALDEHNDLKNYNTDMSFSATPTEVSVVIGGVLQNVTIYFPFTHDTGSAEEKFAWGESYYYRYLGVAGFNYYPSPELLSLYDQTYDLRYKFHIVEDYTYERGAIDPAYSYPGYIFFGPNEILSGPSVPEMLLIKAECQVRQGDFNAGIATANILRTARMDVAAPTNVRDLNAGSQAEALTKVLEERRREMPFLHRWYDLRRFNNNSDPADDVIITRTYYPYSASVILTAEAPITYTLDKNSRHYARPIPDTELVASDDQIQQNQY